MKIIGKILVNMTIVVMFCSTEVLAENIIIKGSTTVLPVAQKCAEYFMNENPNADISVQGGGSGNGIASMIDGTTNIADTSRAMKDKEIKQALQNGVDPKAHVVAVDGIAIVVHASSSVDGLSKQQLKDIYTGSISNWSQVGGPSQKIVVVSRDTSSGTYEAFRKMVLDKGRIRPDALLQASNQAVKSIVSETPGAIGYIGMAYLDDSVKALEMNKIKPTMKTVGSGKYMLGRPLFMYTDGEPVGLTKEFIDFVFSSKGKNIIKSAGYVPVR